MPLKQLEGQAIARRCLLSSCEKLTVRLGFFSFLSFFLFFFFYPNNLCFYWAPERLVYHLLGILIVSLLRKSFALLVLTALLLSLTTWRPTLQFVCTFRTVWSV